MVAGARGIHSRNRRRWLSPTFSLLTQLAATSGLKIKQRKGPLRNHGYNSPRLRPKHLLFYCWQITRSPRF
jgi:hypothetical protein